MNNYTDFLDDKEAFAEKIGSEINARAFAALDELKKEIANDFLKGDEDES